MKWFRLYNDVLNDPKIQRLPDNVFRVWINILCFASGNDTRGRIKADLGDIAFALRMDEEPLAEALAMLRDRGLIDETEGALVPHNWDARQFASDDVALRVAKHREAQKQGVTLHVTNGNVQDTETDTETDTEQTHIQNHTPLTPRGGNGGADFSYDDTAPFDMPEWVATHAPATNGANGVEHTAPILLQPDTTHPTTKPPPKAPPRRAAALPDGFDAFWLAYPKKVGKADAEKAWRHLDPPPELTAEIVAHVTAQSRSWGWSKDRRQFVPNPATYLNGRRWTDEIGSTEAPVSTRPKSQADLNKATGGFVG